MDFPVVAGSNKLLSFAADDQLEYSKERGVRAIQTSRVVSEGPPARDERIAAVD